MRPILILTVFTTLSMPVLAQGNLTIPADTPSLYVEAETMDHDQMQYSMDETGMKTSAVSEPGQGAFAAIAEIVAKLEAEPDTNWSTVNIAGLREHLRDMDIVTIDSVASVETVSGGLKFTITGAPYVSPSIKRMVEAHASVMNGVGDWNYSTEIIENGAIMTVMVPEADIAKLNALGFYGVLASGMHHQAHHWMMATGGNPHAN